MRMEMKEVEEKEKGEKEEWLGKMKNGGFEVLQENVVTDVEDGRDVNFLWVLAKV